MVHAYEVSNLWLLGILLWIQRSYWRRLQSKQLIHVSSTVLFTKSFIGWNTLYNLQKSIDIIDNFRTKIAANRTIVEAYTFLDSISMYSLSQSEFRNFYRKYVA